MIKTSGQAGKALGGRPRGVADGMGKKARQRRAEALERGEPDAYISPPGSGGGVDVMTQDGLAGAVNDLYRDARLAVARDPKAISGAVSLLRLAADLQGRKEGDGGRDTFERLIAGLEG